MTARFERDMLRSMGAMLRAVGALHLEVASLRAGLARPVAAPAPAEDVDPEAWVAGVLAHLSEEKGGDGIRLPLEHAVTPPAPQPEITPSDATPLSDPPALPPAGPRLKSPPPTPEPAPEDPQPPLQLSFDAAPAAETTIYDMNVDLAHERWKSGTLVDVDQRPATASLSGPVIGEIGGEPVRQAASHRPPIGDAAAPPKRGPYRGVMDRVPDPAAFDRFLAAANASRGVV